MMGLRKRMTPILANTQSKNLEKAWETFRLTSSASMRSFWYGIRNSWTRMCLNEREKKTWVRRSRWQASRTCPFQSEVCGTKTTFLHATKLPQKLTSGRCRRWAALCSRTTWVLYRTDTGSTRQFQATKGDLSIEALSIQQARSNQNKKAEPLLITQPQETTGKITYNHNSHQTSITLERRFNLAGLSRNHSAESH